MTMKHARTATALAAAVLVTAAGIASILFPRAALPTVTVDATGLEAGGLVSVAVPATSPQTGRAWVAPVPTSDESVFVLDWEQGQFRISRVFADSLVLDRATVDVPTDTYWEDEIALVAGEDGRVWLANGHQFGFIDPEKGTFDPVSLPNVGCPAAHTADTDEVASAREGHITGLAMDRNGDLWMTRDGAHSVLQYQAERGQFREVEAPASLEEPEAPAVVGDTLLVCDSRRTVAEFERSTYHALSVADGTWRRQGLSGPVLAVRGGSMAVAREAPTEIEVSEDDRTVAVYRLTDLEKGRPPVVLLGEDGDLWFVDESARIVHVNALGAPQTVYELPVTTLENPAVSVPRGGRLSDGAGPIQPAVMDACVDGGGHVWVAYGSGSGWSVARLGR